MRDIASSFDTWSALVEGNRRTKIGKLCSYTQQQIIELAHLEARRSLILSIRSRSISSPLLNFH